MHELAGLMDEQRAFFTGGTTLDPAFRVSSLDTLAAMVENNERAILDALHTDLGKPVMEAYVSEIGFILAEIRWIRRRIRRWARRERAGTMLLVMPAASRIHRVPYGVACIIGPGNYPLQLILSPLAGAIAAGNCAVLKPSEKAPVTSDLLAQLVERHFDRGHVAVVPGGPETSRALLELPFDIFFYTGGKRGGQAVAGAAAKRLVPCVLELGGKNPCIVDRSAKVRTAARRIVSGKFFNAGQTCVAPDYVLAHASVADELVHDMVEAVTAFYGADPAKSPDYGRIGAVEDVRRLRGLMDGGDIVCGGTVDEDAGYVAPTIIRNVPVTARIMREEIFGPVLPLLAVGTMDEAVALVRGRSRPLAMYVFSGDRRVTDAIVSSLDAGGVCVNGTMSQLISFTLPFGGVGASGHGAYHGMYTVEAFSREKSVVRRGTWWDPPFMYPPVTTPLSTVKKALRLLFHHI